MNAVIQASPENERDAKFYVSYLLLKKKAEEGPQFYWLRDFLAVVTQYVNGERVDDANLEKLTAQSKEIALRLKLSEEKIKVNGFKLTPQDQNTFDGAKGASFLFGEIKRRQNNETPLSPAIRRKILGAAGMPYLKAVL